MGKKTQKKGLMFGLLIGLTIVAAWSLFLLFFVATSYTFEAAEDGTEFGVCDFKKDAFCIGFRWEGGQAAFSVPDEFLGCSVTALGGYTGRGYPCPFAVRVAPEVLGYEFSCGEDFFRENRREDDEYETLVVSVRLGSRIRKIDSENVEGKLYLAQTAGDEFDFLCKIAYAFTVDENNPTFYAKAGKLYLRENDELVDDFFYEEGVRDA